jgi:ketosteroid isomerase-like protein
MTEYAERVRRSYEAFASGDLEGALEPMGDDVVWHEAEGLPHGGVYHGLDAVREAVFGPAASWWDGFLATPEEVVGLGEHVLALGRYTARAKATGSDLDAPFAHVWTFRDGKAVRFRQYTDTHGWREALGA